VSDEDRPANLLGRVFDLSVSLCVVRPGLIHRPGSGTRSGVVFARTDDASFFYAAAIAALSVTNSVSSASIRCRTTANLRANAAFALPYPTRLLDDLIRLLTGINRDQKHRACSGLH
jgi:hypothetical protein